MNDMTDKELLTLAAKAAGIQYTEREGVMYVVASLVHSREWNPLTDDGDAFRLAVKLSLTVEVGHDKYSDVWAYPNKDTKRDKVRATEPFDGDPLAATRLAIVRAAAEIGRAMP